MFGFFLVQKPNLVVVGASKPKVKQKIEFVCFGMQSLEVKPVYGKNQISVASCVCGPQFQAGKTLEVGEVLVLGGQSPRLKCSVLRYLKLYQYLVQTCRLLGDISVCFLSKVKVWSIFQNINYRVFTRSSQINHLLHLFEDTLVNLWMSLILLGVLSGVKVLKITLEFKWNVEKTNMSGKKFCPEGELFKINLTKAGWLLGFIICSHFEWVFFGCVQFFSRSVVIDELPCNVRKHLFDALSSLAGCFVNRTD